MKKREFLKTASTIGAGMALAACSLPISGTKGTVAPAKIHCGARMKLSWAPYEIRLAHTFTVASFSRTTTPDVQVEIEYDGIVGYGEASMPPYLGHSVKSVCSFLEKVDLSQFPDPCCTGLCEARKMIAYARAEGMKVMIGCMTETSCATSAAAHLSPVVDFADLDGNLLISNDRFRGMTIRDGMITLPDRPGIGLEKII